MLIGLLILIFGVILLFEELIPGFSIDLSIFWPLLFIVSGFADILRDKKISIVSSIFVIVGTIFLLINLNILDDDFYGIIYPVILIIVGSGIFASNKMKNNKSKISTKIVNNKLYKARNYSGIFGGTDLYLPEKYNIIVTDTSIFG